MNIDRDFGHWLAGFIDGEGCFSIGRLQVRGRDHATYQCTLHVTLRDDDRPLLEEIRRATQIGQIRAISVQRNARSGSKPQACWYVNSKPACLEVVRILDVYPLRSKKARDYAIWRQAVLHAAQMRLPGNRPADWSRMRSLAAELKAVRRYDAPPAVPEPERDPSLF